MTKQPLQKGKLIDPRKLAGLSSDVPVLLAFSGGADSMALLDMMQKEYPAAPILLAHVNHGIRGEEALRDRAFCENIAKERELEIAFLDVDIPAIAKEKGQSLEEAAREVRYAFFADLMRERDIPLLLTAHHADDHLETVLFRIARGTGLSGLCGIAPIRPFGAGDLVRPLLGFTKQEILQYCKQNDLSFVTDSTNADTAYARNRIRADILPIMEELYTDASHRAVRMSAELSEDDAYLKEVAWQLLLKNRTREGISIRALRGAHPAIRRRTLQMWFEEGREASLESVHLQALMSLVESGDTTARVALPGDVSAYCTARGRLSLTKTKPQPVGEYTLSLTIGETKIPNTDISICITPVEKTNTVDKRSGRVLILMGEWEDLQKALMWRNRREGDVMMLGKMHRQVRRLWAAQKIPTELRQALPLLCRGEEIVWTPFVGTSDDFVGKVARTNSSLAYKVEINVSNNAV
ncbi:MAG: tRNA lysidine(34) synthetase TilS [Clostridia bacterium]|nr:tRNA lysidine(34) synthetase TilS [Clostridia bacterium]